MQGKGWASFPFSFTEYAEEVDQLFDELIHRPWGGITSRLWNPSVDVYDTGEGFTVEADLPGVRQSDIGFEISDSNLVLWGERSFQRVSQDCMYYCQERISGRFRRSIHLPDEIETEGIESEFADGVLRLFLPKRAYQEDDYE